MTMDTGWVLGVDGGKSKTVALLAGLGGRVLGWGRSGSSDKYYVTLEGALDEVLACAAQSAGRAGIALEQVACACCGLAGADWDEDYVELGNGLRRRNLAQCILVKNDTHIALRANVPQGCGLVISAGTHLAAAIRTPAGDEWHTSWYGVDGPGGVRAGQRVFWAVMHADDGRGSPTALTGLVLEKTGAAHSEDLLRRLSTDQLDDAFYAGLAPLLFQAHLRFGDAVAACLIQEMAAGMSLWAAGLLRRYDLLLEALPVRLSGGLFKGGDALLFEALSMHIHAAAPHAEIRLASREPVLGALLYAYAALGVPVTPALLENLHASLPAPDFFRTV